MKMVEEFDNSTLSVTAMIDSGITDLTNYIIGTLRFVVSLIMGGVVLVLLGKLINIMLTAPAVVEVVEPIETKTKVVVEVPFNDWSSERSVPATTALSVRKIIKEPIKGSRRKAISVGPVMLTPNSHLIRSINVEDREERFHYDIVPPVPLDDGPVAPENVCVLVARPIRTCPHFPLTL